MQEHKLPLAAKDAIDHKEAWFLQNPANLTAVEDLTELSYLHEPAGTHVSKLKHFTSKQALVQLNCQYMALVKNRARLAFLQSSTPCGRDTSTRMSTHTVGSCWLR